MSVTKLKIIDMRKMFEENSQVNQVEEIFGLNAPAIRSILKNHLHVTKLFLWMPHSLGEDQKT